MKPHTNKYAYANKPELFYKYLKPVNKPHVLLLVEKAFALEYRPYFYIL